MTRKKREHGLARALKKFAGKNIFVAILGSPDPDGIASAWALSLIARKYKVKADLICFESITRLENSDFVRRLNIPLKQVNSPALLNDYEGYCVVDRQSVRLPLTGVKRLPLIAHIDHHSGRKGSAIFSDIRRSVGSTSTIMAEYLKNIPLKKMCDNFEYRALATALLYGIRTDTENFFFANERDFIAASFLSDYSLNDDLVEISEKPLSEEFLKSLKSALMNVRKGDGWLIAYAGRIVTGARDTISQTADFLSRIQNMKTVVVFGLVDKKVLGSMRSSDSKLNPNKYLLNAFRKKFKKGLNCGGRRRAGGFSINLAECDCNFNGQTDKLIDTIFDALKKNLVKME